MDRQPLIFAELEDLSSLAAPLKSTTRVKYTCFNVSANLLVLGASSGGLYVFRREPCVFLQLLPSKEGAVVQLAISPDERLIGVATVRGTVSLVERGQKGSRVVAVSQEHGGSTVTAMIWEGADLYIGDSSGRVSVLARSVFHPPACTLMQLDSQVVQLDIASGFLLVSTFTRSYICDTGRELYRQVGQKLREGHYGACFISSDPEAVTPKVMPGERTKGAYSIGEQLTELDYSHLQHLRAFCSRPGGRLWEVNAEGVVLQTHHLRDGLPPPRPITTDRPLDNNNVASRSQQPIAFGKLFVIQSHYLLTYQEDAVYVVDPWKSDIVLWNNQLSAIVDVRVAVNVAYVWCGSGRMHAINLVPLDKFLVRMYFWKKFQLVAELCVEYSAHLQARAPVATKLHILKDLDEKLRESESATPELLAGLGALLQSLRIHAQNSQVQSARRLKSGIYQITRPNYLGLSNRSQSASPDRVEKTTSRGSSSSLPDLVQEVEEVEGREIMETLSDAGGFEQQDQLDKDQSSAIIAFCSGLDEQTNFPRSVTHRVLELTVRGNDLSTTRPVPFTSFLSPENITKISKCFRQALSAGYALDFLQQCPDLDVSSSHPTELSSAIRAESLQIDLKLSLLLRIFTCVIDEKSIISQIRNFAPDCYYLCLMEVMNIFTTTAISLDPVRDTPPKTMNIALFFLRVGQFDQVARCQLNSKEAMYLVLRLEELLGYGSSALLKSREAWLQCSERASGWSDAQAFSLSCLEIVENWQRCECGFPVPGSNSFTRFPNTATVLLRGAKDDPATGVLLCSRAPSLWPVWLKIRQQDPIITLLPLILHLGAVDELEKRLSELDLLLCEVSVRHLAGLRRGDCLNCGRKLPSKVAVTITWTQLAQLLVKAVGSNSTLKLLYQYSSDVQQLHPSFHQTVVLAALMEKHSKGLRSGVVDVVGGRKQQTALLSPELEAELFSRTGNSSKSGSSHWGTHIPLRSICSACSLSFSARILTNDGVIVFRCLHAYHVICLRRRDKCPICDLTT